MGDRGLTATVRRTSGSDYASLTDGRSGANRNEIRVHRPNEHLPSLTDGRSGANRNYLRGGQRKLNQFNRWEIGG